MTVTDLSAAISALIATGREVMFTESERRPGEVDAYLMLANGDTTVGSGATPAAALGTAWPQDVEVPPCGAEAPPELAGYRCRLPEGHGGEHEAAGCSWYREAAGACRQCGARITPYPDPYEAGVTRWRHDAVIGERTAAFLDAEHGAEPDAPDGLPGERVGAFLDAEPYCAACGASIGHFYGHGDAWLHYTGQGTVASPVELFDAGHAPEVAWRPAGAR